MILITYRAIVNVITSVWQKYIAICNCYGFRKTAYFCGFDNDLESVPGSESSTDPATIYFTESTCNSLFGGKVNKQVAYVEHLNMRPFMSEPQVINHWLLI